MEVELTPEKQAKLQDFATGIGREPWQLVVEAFDRMLEYDERLIEAVEIGRTAARRGELLEHDEVVARIESMFHAARRTNDLSEHRPVGEISSCRAHRLA